MNIKHIFSLAALAVMTAACSSEDITQQPASQSGQTLPFKATISNSAGTRGLTAPSTENPDITATWVVDEQIALIHGATIDVVKVESVEDATSATPGVATLSGDITNYVENEKVYLVYVGCQSGAMDDFKTALVQTFNAAKTADATITAITEDMIKANFKILYQDGTLTTINNGLDYRLATSTLTQTNGWVTLSDSPKLNSQFAIWKLTLKNASGAALAATQLDVIGVEVVASVSIDATTAAADPEEVYVMLPAGTADYRFDATVGTETYTVTHSGVSLTAGNFYQSTLVCKAEATLTCSTDAIQFVNTTTKTKTGVSCTGGTINVSSSNMSNCTVSYSNSTITVTRVNNSAFSGTQITVSVTPDANHTAPADVTFSVSGSAPNYVMVKDAGSTDILGQVICSLGHIHENANVDCGGSPRAMIAYAINLSGSVHGLAIALESAPDCKWDDRASTLATWAASHSVVNGEWRVPSDADFKYMFEACGGPSSSTPTEDSGDLGSGDAYSFGNLPTMLASLNSSYVIRHGCWTNTAASETLAWVYFFNDDADHSGFTVNWKDSYYGLRAILEFY